MQIHDLRILIADDDEDDFILIREFIKDGFPTSSLHIDWARSGQEALSFLDTNGYNVCLLDVRLGEFNGLELLSEVRKTGLALPIIFLTGQGDEETAVEAMKLGASDYFGKSSLSGKTLSHAITQSLELHKEKDQRHIAESTLDAQDILLQAVSDASTVLLTGKNHQDSILEAMKILGKTLKVNSAEIYQNLDSSNGKQKFIKCFTWKNQNSHTENNENIFANPNCGNLELEKKFTSLNENKFTQIAIKELPLPAKERFSAQGIHSFILVPIIIEDVFWGFIAFGNSQPERQWSKNEESLLKTVAASIGSKIRRHDDEVAFHSIVEGTSSQLGDDFFRSSGIESGVGSSCRECLCFRNDRYQFL